MEYLLTAAASCFAYVIGYYAGQQEISYEQKHELYQEGFSDAKAMYTEINKVRNLNIKEEQVN